jgi:NTP pyrophosphatase (non-canonical NTP hydrolase)
VGGTYDWLADEVKELGEALKTDDKKALENEFADVIAWLASLANVTNVDLEKAALNKYDNKCPKCGHIPCQCTF